MLTFSYLCIYSTELTYKCLMAKFITTNIQGQILRTLHRTTHNNRTNHKNSRTLCEQSTWNSTYYTNNFNFTVTYCTFHKFACQIPTVNHTPRHTTKRAHQNSSSDLGVTYQIKNARFIINLTLSEVGPDCVIE